MGDSRRSFLTRVAGAGAFVALADAPLVFAQAPAPAAPEPVIPGTVSNADVLQGKDMSVFKIHGERPLTGSVAAEAHDFDVTPTDRMFVRNNLLTPEVDAAQHRLAIKGLVARELTYSLDELKRSFKPVTRQAMLECAGAGRTAFQPTPRGTPWLPTGGMGCPRWTGVPLADVLRAAGVRANAVHVAGQGADFGAVPTIPPVIRSIPMSKAMEENTLIVWDMNGAPLPKVHGFPIRLLVPGWAGSASIKWLHTLTVLDAPFKGTYMDDSYRMPTHPVAPGERMPKDTVSTEAWPVKSIITAPAPNAKFRVGEPILVRGKAWVGEGAIRRVEISLDEGVTWQAAQLDPRGDKYAWRGFRFLHRPKRPGFQTFLARAWDDQGNAQPMVAAWNPLGYYWNGVHRVGVSVEA
jgi:DMSO/TMAO reductase YedYZ molybdopterin-dependent catalytic subunit